MRMGTVAVAALLALAGCKKKHDSAPPPPKPAVAPEQPAVAEPTGAAAVATTFVRHLARGEIAAAVAMMPSGKVTADQLGSAWTTRVGDGGALRELTLRVFPENTTTHVVRAELERGTIDVLVDVAGGAIVGVSMGWLYQPPAYVDRGQFTEAAFTVGSGKTALPGVLSVPQGTGPFPVVVLQQGSGPSDLDEGDPTVPIVLFRDLAWGLASRGVAVLRYDKRSWPLHFLELGVPIDKFTVKEEYFDGLALALDALAHDGRVDPRRIFVLGHSQAGWLLPWMMRDHPGLAGGIIASGCARSMVDLLPEQNHYLASLNKQVSAIQLEVIDRMTKDQVARAHDPELADDAPPSDLPLGVPAHYWKTLQGYDAPAVVATLTKPLLVLQGGRDYNVPMTDFAMWKQALAKHPDATFHDYPALEHHYLAGTGTATPDELNHPGHADVAVIDDIAAWVKAH